MSLEIWLAFCAAEIVLCLIPGPAILLVFSVALAQGFRPSLAASLGIITVNACYFIVSGTGVAAILLASNELFTALKWAGVAYLMWIGLKMLFSRQPAFSHVAPNAVRRSYLRGIVAQGSNPKALIFFVMLLPQFVDPHEPIWGQIVLLGITGLVIEFLVAALYTALGVHARNLAGARFIGPLERLGGGFLIAVAGWLALADSD